MSTVQQFSPPHSRVVADLTAAHAQDVAEDKADARMIEKVTQPKSAEEAKARRDKVELAVDAPVFLVQEPPSAADLGVDVGGLPEMRGRLIRYTAWVADLQRQLKLLEDGRTTYLRSVGAVAVDQAALDDLIETDTLNFVRWLSSGSDALSKPTVRAFEREAMEKALPERRHERQIALAAMSQIELQVDVLVRRIAILESRHESFVHAAVIEHADQTIGPEYRAKMVDLASTIAELFGLASVVRRGNVSSDLRLFRGDNLHTTVDMPWFGLQSVVGGSSRPPQIEVPESTVRRAAPPWRTLAEVWADDPRADPPATPAEA